MAIVLLGDFLRPSLDKTFNQALNLQWLAQIIGHDLAKCGMPLVNTDQNILEIEYSKLFDIVYPDIEGIELLDAWAQVYEEFPKYPVFQEIGQRLQGNLVIVFEPSRAIRRFLDDLSIVYIEIGIHPLRFGDDLFLSIKSNDTHITNRLLKYARSIDWQKQLWKQFKEEMRPTSSPVSKSALIFLAQTSYDASIIENGSFFSLQKNSALKQLDVANKVLFSKQHPLDLQSQSYLDWSAMFPSSEAISTNIYQFFCSEEPLKFISISSGSGYEAELAGHQVLYLSSQATSLNHVKWSSHHAIGQEIWSEGFWPYLFTGSTPEPQENLTMGKDKLRQIIGQWWGKELTSQPVDDAKNDLARPGNLQHYSELTLPLPLD